MKPMMNNILANYLVYTNGGNKKNPYGDIMRITTAMKTILMIVIDWLNIILKTNRTNPIIAYN